MLKKKKSVLWLLLALLASGCSFMEVEPSYLVDAFLSTQVIDGDTMVAVNGYVQSDYPMSAVKMYHEDESFSYELSSVYEDGYSFEHVADSNDFVSDFDGTGLVYFEMEHDGEYHGLQADYLYNNLIYPFEVTNVVPDTLGGDHSDNAETIIWDNVEDADYVCIYLTMADTLIYSRVYISGYHGSFKIKSNDTGWINSYVPKKGDEFKVQMTAMMMEDALTYISNLQCVTFSKNIYSFIWTDE